MANGTNQGEEVMDIREGQSSSAPATAEDVSEGVSEPSIFVKACQCLESNGEVLTEEGGKDAHNKYDGKVQLYRPS